MLKVIKRLFKKKKKAEIAEKPLDDSQLLKKMPISTQVKEIIDQASNNIKGPY